jgi:hypothetical protein
MGMFRNRRQLLLLSWWNLLVRRSLETMHPMIVASVSEKALRVAVRRTYARVVPAKKVAPGISQFSEHQLTPVSRSRYALFKTVDQHDRYHLIPARHSCVTNLRPFASDCSDENARKIPKDSFALLPLDTRSTITSQVIIIV